MKAGPALPAINATLNALSGVLLVLGYLAIRRRRVGWHRACMVGAFVVSTAFLACYVVYHAQVGSVRFRGQGWMRPVYFTILVSHVTLAMAILPLAIRTLTLAVQGRILQHRRWARVTLPLWLYVSVTGVLVYYFVYQWT